MTAGDRGRGEALAFDFGLARIGAALANPVTGLASPLLALPATNGAPDWRALDALVAEWRPQVLVVGVPYNADGSDSALAPAARAFGDSLGERYRLPVETIDESLSSAEASDRLRRQRAGGIRPGRVRKGDVDAMAAQVIAENWLARLPG